MKQCKIQVIINGKKYGWLEETIGVPAVFASPKEAKKWISENTPHPGNYVVVETREKTK